MQTDLLHEEGWEVVPNSPVWRPPNRSRPTLRVRDDDNAWSSWTTGSVTVTNRNPSVSISPNSGSWISGSTITFTATATDPDAGHDTFTYNWRCDDGDTCTVDICDGAGACVNEEVDCNDDDLCTFDFCDAAGECRHSSIGCGDGDACTADDCDPVLGCVSEIDPGACRIGVRYGQR